jgi:2-polyprenyl-3-methyl-5-hydroxy-6-metoxy-1,4-benzoquinol methylase
MSRIDTSRRTDRSEIMDDFDLQGEELETTLKDLEKVNKWLGGNKITMLGIKKLLNGQPEGKTIHIADVGCGDGAILREIAEWGRNKPFTFKLTGIDANSHAIGIAERLSEFYPEIKYKTINIFDPVFQKEKFDIVLCTLTLHHFKDNEIKELIKKFSTQARIGVVINDLHRSKQAYFLFRAFCKVFIRNKIARDDGLTSILRGFKKKEIKKFASALPVERHEISWKWAYRYLWIIEK